LLDRLSEAVLAFQDDLNKQNLEERVVGMTYSEFGRRIVSNGSWGTDHGAAAPLFVFGTQVNPMIHGSNPVIPRDPGPTDNLPMQFDFRSVYGSILMDWFCVEEEVVKSLLFEDFQYVPVLKASTTSAESLADPSTVKLEQNFPNPADGSTRISFNTPGGWIRISLFDNRGIQLKVLTEQQFTPGEHTINLDTHDLASGMYYYRLQFKDQQRTRSMVVR
jgi:hypothetical protein